MADTFINRTSVDKSYDIRNITALNDDYINGAGYNLTLSISDYFTHQYNNTHHGYGCKPVFIMPVLSWVIICTGLPLTIMAICMVFSLVRNDHVAPIFVINLLISDLIQLCCITIWTVNKSLEIHKKFTYIYDFGLMASVGFMVCISLERYLAVIWPLWYRCRRSIKSSLVVCVMVWALPLIYVLPVYFLVAVQITETIVAVFLLLPLPLLIFFLGGTTKALSAARSVSADEKRQIVAILVAVLLIYTLLFLPNIIWSLLRQASSCEFFTEVAANLLQLSPLADLTLYIFMRKGFTDKLLAPLCCCVAVSSINKVSV